MRKEKVSHWICATCTMDVDSAQFYEAACKSDSQSRKSVMWACKWPFYQVAPGRAIALDDKKASKGTTLMEGENVSSSFSATMDDAFA